MRRCEGCSEEFEGEGYWFEEELEGAVVLALGLGVFGFDDFVWDLVVADLGKKARMKMPRKMMVFLRLVSKGI